MTALAKERFTRVRKAGGLDLPVKANVKIWKGARIVMTGGYAEPATAATGLTNVGKASDNVDNTGGADGALTVHVEFSKEKTLVPMIGDAGNPFAQANMGGPAYFLDDQTVTTVSTGHTSMGTAWTFETVNGVQTVYVEES